MKCCQLSLYESCDEHAGGLFSTMIEMTHHVYHISGLFLLNRGACIDCHVFIHAYSIISERNRRIRYK